MDRRWRTTIGEIVREGQATGEFAPVDAETFALRLAALIDGLAILVVLQDPEVSRERMFDLCMDTCARELGFSWTAEDRGQPGRAPRSVPPQAEEARTRRASAGRWTAMASMPCRQVIGWPWFWISAWSDSPLARRTTSWVDGPW